LRSDSKINSADADFEDPKDINAYAEKSKSLYPR